MQPAAFSAREQNKYNRRRTAAAAPARYLFFVSQRKRKKGGKKRVHAVKRQPRLLLAAHTHTQSP
jgi:hypothetical protein